MKDQMDDFNTIVGDVNIPRLMDHLTKIKLFYRVKQMFTNEVKMLEEDMKEMNQQNKIMKNILSKLLRNIMDYEFKNSTSDWRTIYGKELGDELLSSQQVNDEKIDSTLQALLPNMSKEMIDK